MPNTTLPCFVCGKPLDTSDVSQMRLHWSKDELVCTPCWNHYVDTEVYVAGGQGRGADDVLSTSKFLMWVLIGCAVWAAVAAVLGIWRWS